MIYGTAQDGFNYNAVEEGDNVVETIKKIKPQGATAYMLDNGNLILVDSCPVCGKNATVNYDARYGYTCACNTSSCHMHANKASHFPTAFAAIHNWNVLCLAIDITKAKGGVDESVMARIFGQVPDDD